MISCGKGEPLAHKSLVRGAVQPADEEGAVDKLARA